MTNNIPSNPFERPKQTQDPRNSRLFATGENDPYSSVPQSNPEMPRRTKSSIPVMSARRELRLKHSQLRRNILIGISVAIGLILALIATDTLKLGTGPRPTISKTGGAISQLTRRPTSVAGEQIESIRTPTGNDPLRAYIAGDSLVGSFASSLATSLGESGVIKPTYDWRQSSGLVNTSFFNWNTHLKQALSSYKPEIIIFTIGTNDASIVSSNPRGYVADYSKKLNDFIDVASGSDRKIIFVLAPAMRESALNKNLDKLNNVIYAVANQRQIFTIESSAVLSPDGIFVKNIKSNKKSVAVRADDGVHITNAGGKLLASYIEKFVNKTFGLDRFSDTPAIKPIKATGCCKSPTSVPSGTLGSSTTSTTSSEQSTTTSSSTSQPETVSTQVTSGQTSE